MRVFIGIELNYHVKKTLKSYQHNIKPYIEKGRLTQPDNLHLTLRFIGGIDPEQLKNLESVLETVGDLYHDFDLKLGELGAFDKKNRKILWAGISEGTEHLEALYILIQNELKRIGIEPELRGLSAHITLGRQIKLSETLNLLRDKYPVEKMNFHIKKLTLFESTRVDDQLTYVPIARALLRRQRG